MERSNGERVARISMRPIEIATLELDFKLPPTHVSSRIRLKRISHRRKSSELVENVAKSEDWQFQPIFDLKVANSSLGSHFQNGWTIVLHVFIL